jgi:hypothetical protein
MAYWRAKISVGPPAGKGTIKRMVLLGKLVCACAKFGKHVAPAMVAMNATSARRLILEK